MFLLSSISTLSVVPEFVLFSKNLHQPLAQA